jgi:uncharacterized RDD family membrane protein YckC
MEKIGFGPRLVAYLIDGILLSIVNGILGAVFAMTGSDTLVMLGSLLTFIISIGYFVYFWTSSGQTIGHSIMKIKVVSTDGSTLTMGKAFMRYIGYIISGLVVGLGFLWVLFDADKQGWHDKIAGTYVIKA